MVRCSPWHDLTMERSYQSEGLDLGHFGIIQHPRVRVERDPMDGRRCRHAEGLPKCDLWGSKGTQPPDA